MSFRLLQKLLIFLIVPASASSAKYEGYRFKLDIGNPDVYCPDKNYTCDNGQLHYLCTGRLKPHQRCRCYRPLRLTKSLIKIFVQGTNGLRNKVAIDMGISNMNIVYWSHELSEMANRFLRECLIGYDPCLIIGEKQIRVSQNIAFYKGEIDGRWPGRVVRHWYLEMGHQVKTWEDYQERHEKGFLGNLTIMAYPMVEFIGCGAARMLRGHFVVCYYHPPYIRNDFPKNFTIGKACSKCSRNRKMCSKTFTALCGVDFEISGGQDLHLDFFSFTVLIFVSIFLY